MLWVTRHEPHLDRCASAWLIKRFIDRDAEFRFIDPQEQIPRGATPFVLPGAEINPVEGEKTTFDVLMDKYLVKDLVAAKIRSIIRDFEVDAAEDTAKLKLAETAGLYKIIRGLARTTKNDQEIIATALKIFDALYAQLQTEANENTK